MIRAGKPDCSVTICGRDPGPDIRALAQHDPGLTVTGTVTDVRPYLWGGRVFIVPLRVGGGARLKIYEPMAARVPLVSTTIGAGGLADRDREHLFLADDPQQFARDSLLLRESADTRLGVAEAAWQLVSSSFSGEQVTRSFEQLIEARMAVSGRCFLELGCER